MITEVGASFLVGGAFIRGMINLNNLSKTGLVNPPKCKHFGFSLRKIKIR